MSTDVEPVSSTGGIKSQVMSALRWTAAAKFGGQLANWAITLFVMRLLAPADYGLVAMMTLLFAFLGMLGDMGFGSSIVQAPTLDLSEIRQTLGAALLINVGICVFLLVAAPAVAAFYNEPRLTDMIRVASLGFLGAGIAPVYSGMLQREMRFRVTARIEIVTSVVGNVATLGFALGGFNAWALILGTLVANPLRIAMLVASADRVYLPLLRFAGTRRLWTFGSNVLVDRVVWYWAAQVDVLIAGKLLGREALGFYSVAVHLASLPMQRASGIINGVAFAAFAKIQHDPRAVAHNTRLAVRLMAFITFPILWGISAVAPELVMLAIGPTWQPSIVPLTLVALTVPFRMISSIVASTIMSLGRVDVSTRTVVVGAIIAPPIFYVGAQFGIIGLSVAWLVYTPILTTINLYRALPILGVSVRQVVAECWRPLVVSGVMFVAVEATRHLLAGLGDGSMFACLVAVGSLVYAGGTWFFNREAMLEAMGLLFPRYFTPVVSATPTTT